MTRRPRVGKQMSLSPIHIRLEKLNWSSMMQNKPWLCGMTEGGRKREDRDKRTHQHKCITVRYEARKIVTLQRDDKIPETMTVWLKIVSMIMEKANEDSIGITCLSCATIPKWLSREDMTWSNLCQVRCDEQILGDFRLAGWTTSFTWLWENVTDMEQDVEESNCEREALQFEMDGICVCQFATERKVRQEDHWKTGDEARIQRWATRNFTEQQKDGQHTPRYVNSDHVTHKHGAVVLWMNEWIKMISEREKRQCSYGM